MPRLWNETIEAHQQAVHDAVLDATAELVATRGLAAVSMSGIAEAAGIGRATLYRYFPDLDAILTAWHARTVSRHLGILHEAAEREATPADRLAAVLQAYANQAHDNRNHAAPAALHQSDHVKDAHRHLRSFVTQLIVDAQRAGAVRAEIAAPELASFAIAALEAAGAQGSKAAVGRLVTLVLDGLRPPTRSSRA